MFEGLRSSWYLVQLRVRTDPKESGRHLDSEEFGGDGFRILS